MDEHWQIVIAAESAEHRAEARQLLQQGADRRYAFIEAENGSAAIAACRGDSGSGARGVLLDDHLPDMDAFDVLAALRDNDGGTICPVVVLTGAADPTRARAFVRAGAHGSLAKSWLTPDSLTRSLDNAVERWALVRELRASEQRLSLTQRIAGLGTWDWDLETGTATWTEEAWRLFGRAYASVSVTYDVWLTSLLPEDRERASAKVQEALETGAYRDEFRVRSLDGEVRWLESRGEAVRNATGRATQLIGTVQDITERKRTEQALRTREQRLRLALRAGKTGVWEWSFSDDRVIWSDETSAIFGVPPGEFEGTLAAFERVLHPEDREAVLANVRAALDTGSEYAFEFRIIRRDGQVRRVTNLGLLQRDESGAPSSIIGTVTDVTEQREAEENLRDAERELRLVAENTPDIIARFDRALRHTYVNGAVERATGLPRSAFLGKTNREIGMPVALCDGWDMAIDRVFRTAEPSSLDFAFDSPSGMKHFEASLVPELDARGEVEHVLIVTHDVTTRVKAEEQLRDNDRRKDLFLATLAHELRNPLAPVRTGLELLRINRDPVAQERAIAVMNRQVTQMVHIIDDLLDVSRIGSGKVALQRTRICLQETVVAALEASRPVIDAAKHSLRVEQPDDPIWLYADSTRVTQVVSNLLTNAAKYTPRGGRVVLKTRSTDALAEIEVSDTGVGIPAALFDRIFDMFTQVNSSLDRAQGGLGIGLALVKRLVEMHGGTVHVASPGEGLGSTFTIRLPLADRG